MVNNLWIPHPRPHPKVLPRVMRDCFLKNQSKHSKKQSLPIHPVSVSTNFAGGEMDGRVRRLKAAKAISRVQPREVGHSTNCS